MRGGSRWIAWLASSSKPRPSGRPHHLSFGERKRACLAGVLACQPSVLVLDEPTANLDPRSRRRFIQLIAGLECTKLIATHDLEMVLELCPRIGLARRRESRRRRAQPGDPGRRRC